MSVNIRINVFDPASIEAAIKQLEDYSKSLDDKASLLAEKLAEKGLWYAEWNFSSVQWTYSGAVDYQLDVEKVDNTHYVITAGGETVLFLEFGAGAKLGYGHPKAQEMGMGPGTYPNGKGHWDSPHGWWYADEGGKHHTYGNAPGMPMYNAAQDLKNEILQTAREVFGGG